MSAARSYAPGSRERVRGEEWVVEKSMHETLYEVHEAGARVDETDQAFLVPESELDRYSEDELTFEGEDRQPGRRPCDPGTFIFRLAGPDRETSASYYTREVLTDCGVKGALKELLDGGMEPDPDRSALEADVIVSVTLWLTTMRQGQEAPRFGARLAVGNSLVAARLAVWYADDLQTDDGLKKELTRVLKKARRPRRPRRRGRGRAPGRQGRGRRARGLRRRQETVGHGGRGARGRPSGRPSVGHDRETFEPWQHGVELGASSPAQADTNGTGPPWT